VARRSGKISDLPVKRKKAERRVEERTVILLRCGNRFGLMKRPDEGLLASLYEPINLLGAMTHEEICAWLSARGILHGDITDIGEAVHIFTHIEWHMHGYLIDVSMIPSSAEVMLATVQEMDSEYAIPSAYRYFVRKMKALE
jgi:A/G-specific adenine glycosylase